MIKVISFDCDGTLIDGNFNNYVWYEEIPKLYAEKYKMSFDEAYKIIKSEYDEYERKKDIRWGNPSYWIRKYKLNTTLEDVVKKEKIKIFDDVDILEQLKERYILIVFSVCSKDYLDIKLITGGLERYFEKTFSMVTDFKDENSLSKTSNAFRKICKNLGVQPYEIVHIGDSVDWDYKPAKEANIKALLIDRDNKYSNQDINKIRSLRELKNIL